MFRLVLLDTRMFLHYNCTLIFLSPQPFHRSTVPPFRRSIVPPFHRSIVPSFHRSIVPSFQLPSFIMSLFLLTFLSGQSSTQPLTRCMSLEATTRVLEFQTIFMFSICRRKCGRRSLKLRTLTKTK